MEVVLQPGAYVVAVSGGVDSIVLLDLLRQMPDVRLTIAHFDHGIRADSARDAQFVERLAQTHGLPVVIGEGKLGPTASEQMARNARYTFLQQVQQQAGAEAIITAHHLDDVLETAILNLLRGTGRRGLSSLQSSATLLRPLLAYPKTALLEYATQQNVSWREDTTNHDIRYTRNYIRHRLLVRFGADARQQLLALIQRMSELNTEANSLLTAIMTDHMNEQGLDRRWLATLPHDVTKEVLADWLRQNALSDYDRQALERLSIHVKTKAVGKRLDVLHGRSLHIGHDYLALEPAER